MLGLLLMFLVSGTSFGLTVVADDGAIVYFNGELIGAVRGGQLTFQAKLPGVLRVVKSGYAPYETYITEDGRYVIELKLYAYIVVRVSPSNAEVFVNDERTIPGVRKEVPSGPVKVTVRAKGYTEWSKTIEAKPLEVLTLDVKLKTTTTLKLRANIDVDEVYFESERVKLPATLEVMPGKYVLTLSENYEPSRFIVEVPPLDEFTYELNVKRKYLLTIRGNPEGAFVRVAGGVYRAPTQLLLTEGTYEILIELQGYKPLKVSRELFRNDILEYFLEPEMTHPVEFMQDYTVEIDGFVRDKMPSGVWFTKLLFSGKTIWFGFSSGQFKAYPMTLPVAIGKGVELRLPDGRTFSGPSLVQVVRGSKVSLAVGGRASEVVVNEPIVRTTSDKCLVNVFSRSVLDLYVNGVYQGRTPLYLLTLPAGTHNFTFKRGQNLVEEREVTIVPNELNEVKVDK